MSNQIVSTSYNIPVNTSQNLWFGLSTAIDAIVYRYAARRYYFTLTGNPDIEIPISSFQCRRRNGESTYLQVVIPGIDYSAEIADRSSGDMVIEMSYWFGGVDNYRTEIARGTLDGIRIDEGGQNKSITLTGYKTETLVTKTVDIESESTYRSVSADGKITHRFAEPDIYVNPGDTVTIGTDELVVSMMTYSISVSSQSMELSG